MADSNEKGDFMQKEIPLEKTKRHSKSRTYKDPTQRLRKEWSDPAKIEELRNKMETIANEGQVTLMTKLARLVGFKTHDELYQVVYDHPELHDTFESCKTQVGINAYDGIENRKLAGTYSRFSVTRFLKEVRKDRDEEREFELKKIQARKEAQKEQYQEIITEIREKNGKKVAVISVDENILLPDEE
jgi:hypothetical protein